MVLVDKIHDAMAHAHHRGGIPDSYFLEEVCRARGTSYQTNTFLIGSDSCRAYGNRTSVLDLAIATRLPPISTWSAWQTALVWC